MNFFISFLSKYSLAPLVRLLFIKDIKGIDNLPKKNFILASNHQSYLDIPLCGYVCVPRRFTFIGQVDRKEGWNFIRNIIYLITEVIPVNRGDKNSKDRAFLKAVEMIKKGYCLNIYPEGTRSKTGEVQEGKWGVAKLFLETEVPVVPLGISGAFDIFPPGQKPKVKKVVKLNIGKPMFFKEELEKSKNISSSSEQYKDICIEITNKIMEEIKRLVHEN
ncbi:MAG: lysophospholipid acyltransferase family protein [Candidatus Paceibacterota bacterium]|jgi:1-acyl-sn-glycerol-3-phosphate acyltransferase